jgi:hypothetical protein
MKLGQDTHSLMNWMYGNSTKTVPEVGMAATLLYYTDREPATVVKVYTPRKIGIKQDHAKRIDKNGMSESQEYEYTPNPEAGEEIFRLGKRGWKNKGGTFLSLGIREKYHDFSF